jgi:hypothetical protein
MNRSYSKIRHIQEANMLLERRRVISEQSIDPKKMAETQAIPANYITTDMSLDQKGGRPIKVTKTYVGGDNVTGGVKLFVEFGLPDFNLKFPIYSTGGKAKAQYYGSSDSTTAKTNFDRNWVTYTTQNFDPNGTNSTVLKNAIWNAITAIVNKYNSDSLGVAS